MTLPAATMIQVVKVLAKVSILFRTAVMNVVNDGSANKEGMLLTWARTWRLVSCVLAVLAL